MKFKLSAELLKKNKYLKSSDISAEIMVCTDTRTIEPNEWFLPIVGENFDGHNFVQELKDKCAGVIFDVSKLSKEQVAKSHKNFICVDETTRFFQECGKQAILNFKSRGGLVIGLTGSNGKTTNKEYLFSILNAIMPNKVYATRGNYNNHLGVPFSCLSIEKNQEVAIIEMGTNHFGEIKVLCEIAQPDVGFITNIGDAHLEFLENRDGVLREKRALYDYVVKHSKAVFKFLINGEDKHLSQLDETLTGVESSKRHISVNQDEYDLTWNDQKVAVENQHIFGRINFYNLAMMSLFALKLYPQKSQGILEQIGQVTPPQNNRSMWITWKNKKVYLDAYNANPSSMQVSLEAFMAHLKKADQKSLKALFILGDMKELGEHSAEKHQAIGQQLAEFFKTHENSRAYFVGAFANDYLQGLGEFAGRGQCFENYRDVAQGQLTDDQIIFVKGSRSIGLERLFS